MRPPGYNELDHLRMLYDYTVIKKTKPIVLAIYETDSIWWHNHPRHTTTENYDNYGIYWYFRFDGDKMMSYKYILPITSTGMYNLNSFAWHDLYE